MKKIQILDCTLRDGGYLLDAKFGDRIIKGIIKKLAEARVDVIECGYLKDIPHQKDTCIFSDVNEVIPYLPENRGISSYVLFADYSRYKAVNLKPYDGKSIDGLRECFMKHERKDAMRIVKIMKEAGYKVYVQPVDLMYYNDYELLELISWVNEIEPYAFSMVDTFGSMYVDDIQRIFPLVNHNLSPKIKMGFHSHNNLQLSSAIAQEFVRLSSTCARKVVIDGTICGMGRGAGNTCTELIAEFLNKKYAADYDMDVLLDLIDIYMPEIRQKCSWGYSIPFLIAGMYNAHVHNISYLLDKYNLNTKNMRQIIEKVDPITRKKYDYENLKKIYIEHVSKSIDDTNAMDIIRRTLLGKNILLVAPGKNGEMQKEKIDLYQKVHHALVISINFIPSFINPDIVYFSNYRRLEEAKENGKEFYSIRKILTSNVNYNDENTLEINYNDYIKQGWFYFDNATIMLLRLLVKIGIREVAIAGFDGYVFNSNNYSISTLELKRNEDTINLINSDAKEMLADIKSHSNIKINFITDSLYEEKAN